MTPFADERGRSKKKFPISSTSEEVKVDSFVTMNTANALTSIVRLEKGDFYNIFESNVIPVAI